MPTSTFSSTRHLVEQALVLEGAGEARRRDPVRRQTGDVACPSNRIEPALAGKSPVSDVEEGRLARAVGADHADDLAGLDDEVEALQGLQAAERARQAATSSRGATSSLRSPIWPLPLPIGYLTEMPFRNSNPSPLTW